MRLKYVVVLCVLLACQTPSNPPPTPSGQASPDASSLPEPTLAPLQVLYDDAQLPEPEILNAQEWRELTQSGLVEALNRYGIARFQELFAEQGEQYNLSFSPLMVAWGQLIRANLLQGQERQELLTELGLQQHSLQEINRWAALLRREVYRNRRDTFYSEELKQNYEVELVISEMWSGLVLENAKSYPDEVLKTLHQDYGVHIIQSAQRQGETQSHLQAWLSRRSRGEAPQLERQKTQDTQLWTGYFFKARYNTSFEEPATYFDMLFSPLGQQNTKLAGTLVFLTTRFNQEGNGEKNALVPYIFLSSSKREYNLDIKFTFNAFFVLPGVQGLNQTIQKLLNTPQNVSEQFIPSTSTHTLISIPRFSISARTRQMTTADIHEFTVMPQFQHLNEGTFQDSSYYLDKPRNHLLSVDARFKADRPFIYGVTHRELGLILQIGTVIDPRQGESL